MDKQTALNIGLPKWPQCIIKGKSISEEQALEIIRRTDSFFLNGFGGNNNKFNEKALEICRMPDIMNIVNLINYEKQRRKFIKKWQTIETNYLHNSWVSCSYIGGPHGWCHPDGTIEYHDNIGKWPDMADIHYDLITIGKHFPFIELTCTLMSAEECECDKKALVTMKLKDGKVEFLDPLPSEELKYEPTKHISFMALSSPNKSYENYFSLDQIKKWADQVYSKE